VCTAAGLDSLLLSLLDTVGLASLLEREYYGSSDVGWDTSTIWEDTLSLGEQQRLVRKSWPAVAVPPAALSQTLQGMARLFFRRPTFAILDECTNATSVDIEDLLYQHCAPYAVLQPRFEIVLCCG
jgi:ABC-type uncharacterized transport system fused permease/ATPase subunit